MLHAAKASFLPEDEKSKLVSEVQEKLALYEKETSSWTDNLEQLVSFDIGFFFNFIHFSSESFLIL